MKYENAQMRQSSLDCFQLCYSTFRPQEGDHTPYMFDLSSHWQ